MSTITVGQTLTTEDELDAAPSGTILMDRDHDAWQVEAKKLIMAGSTFSAASEDVLHLAPFTVLHVPPRNYEVGDMIDTPAELETLPSGTIVLDPHGAAWLFYALGGYTTTYLVTFESDVTYLPRDLDYPVKLIHLPEGNQS